MHSPLAYLVLLESLLPMMTTMVLGVQLLKYFMGLLSVPTVPQATSRHPHLLLYVKLVSQALTVLVETQVALIVMLVPTHLQLAVNAAIVNLDTKTMMWLNQHVLRVRQALSPQVGDQLLVLIVLLGDIKVSLDKKNVMFARKDGTPWMSGPPRVQLVKQEGWHPVTLLLIALIVRRGNFKAPLDKMVAINVIQVLIREMAQHHAQIAMQEVTRIVGFPQIVLCVLLVTIHPMLVHLSA
jgi:hypothetical protein